MYQFFNVIMGNEDGQYRESYVPCVIKNGIRMSDGLSLIEQSYLDRYFSLAVTLEVIKHDRRVAWVGEYAKTEFEKISIPGGVEMPDFEEAWPEDRRKLDDFHVMRLGDRIPWHSSYLMYTGYLVNVDKKEYVDMRKYVLKSMYKKEMRNVCMNPLVLLTAVGDDGYKGTDNKMMGAWAWNLIGFREEVPKGYTEITPTFREK